jgi:hypothetical protein
MGTKRFRVAIVAFTKSREVFQANAVINAGDEIAQQRRLNDYIKELEDQQAVYSQPGHTATSPTARNYLTTLGNQIASMKAAKMRTVSSGPEPVYLALARARQRLLPHRRIARRGARVRAALDVDPNWRGTQQPRGGLSPDRPVR